jgi:hypothetical protein
MEFHTCHSEHDASTPQEKRVYSSKKNDNRDAVQKEPVKGLP